VADEDVTFVEAALQVVETFASRFTRRAVLFTSVIRKRSTFGQDGEQRMNVRPLHDRINVHRLEAGEQQIGGIIIPNTAKEKPQQGTVTAVGDGKANDNGKRIPVPTENSEPLA
jgi:hypothetical protein